jgi:K+/H+ antiporter YhaU regulatory subunit KhtT
MVIGNPMPDTDGLVRENGLTQGSGVAAVVIRDIGDRNRVVIATDDLDQVRALVAADDEVDREFRNIVTGDDRQAVLAADRYPESADRVYIPIDRQ